MVFLERDLDLLHFHVRVFRRDLDRRVLVADLVHVEQGEGGISFLVLGCPTDGLVQYLHLRERMILL